MVDSDLANLIEVKLIINISGTSEDAILTNFKESVDREIDNWMRPYVDVIPILSPSEELIEAANAEVASRWFSFIKDFKTSEYWHKRYNEIKQSIEVKEKATPSTMTAYTSVTKPYLSSPLADE
jgi:hypothetical protein